MQETFAANLLSNELEAGWLSVKRGVGQMPTAFVASWGEGKPIIGILGEYDALPGLSQNSRPGSSQSNRAGQGMAVVTTSLARRALGAVLALKAAMIEQKLPGTIRFYGCPAEETLVGKTFMAKDGVFDDLDAALAWHPGDTNMVWHGSSLAMNSFKVNFHGVAAHGAAAPHLGRSALDGVHVDGCGGQLSARTHHPRGAESTA